MPYTLNGFGTRYYGRREPGDDGSYITTLWITALYIPVLPLGSYRVLPVGKGTNYVVHSSQSYRVLKQPMCWEQVWRVYMVGAPILFLIGWFWWHDARNDRMKSALQNSIQTHGHEVETARVSVEKAAAPCAALLKSRENANHEFEAVKLEMNAPCQAWVDAQDKEIEKIGRYQEVIAGGLSSDFLDSSERDMLTKMQALWKIRRHEAEESRQVAACMADLSKECYAEISPLIESLKQEDQQACTLLASMNEKCE